MRTEYKAGLIFALIIVVGVVFYAVNQGGPGGSQIDRLPFDVTGDEAEGIDIIDLAAEESRPAGRTSADETPAPRRSTPPTPVDVAAPGPTDPGLSRRPPAIAGPLTDQPGAASPAGERPATLADRLADRSVSETGPTGEPGVVGVPTSRPIAGATAARGPGVALPPRRAKPPLSEDRAARVREAPKPEAVPARYTAQLGDTLSSIAREHFGEARCWTAIRDANPGIDPDRLQVGQVILLPAPESVAGSAARPAAKEAQPKAGEARTGLTRAPYVVGRGDTLTSIARNLLGDGSRWREIYELNRDKLDNPDVIKEGTELRLPPIEKKNEPQD